MSALQDPSAPGTFAFDDVVYAAPGLDYTTDPRLTAYAVYHQPTNSFSTRRIDLSPFAEFDFRFNWPFTNADAPLNGLARIPIGPGPFPLVLFAHGNHTPAEHSTPGYLYLCELLASHGIIAATIDVNFLNGRIFGENDGRAIVQLEHVRQFLRWHGTAGHPLNGKVDAEQIMIVGHSRGGEAAGHASQFNRLRRVQPDAASPFVPLDGSQGLGPYRVALKGIVAIAPTDQQYVPVGGPTRVRDNYLLLHGSRDNDVFFFPGYATYDRSHAVDLTQPTQPSEAFKALLWVHRANHNFFNSVWAQESSGTITRDEQERIAKVYISALAHAVLLGNAGYLELLKDHGTGVSAGWLPNGVTLVSQYQEADRLYLQHFEEPANTFVVSEPVRGTVQATNVTARKLAFNLGMDKHLFQETSGAQVTWTGAGGFYRLEFTPQPLDTSNFHFLALRVGQSFEAQNPVGREQDFTLSFGDGSGTFELTAGSINRLVYPAAGTRTEAKTIMQTLRVPLQRLRDGGLDTRRLASITLSFDRTASGRVYFDDVHLTR